MAITRVVMAFHHKVKRGCGHFIINLTGWFLEWVGPRRSESGNTCKLCKIVSSVTHQTSCLTLFVRVWQHTLVIELLQVLFFLYFLTHGSVCISTSPCPKGFTCRRDQRLKEKWWIWCRSTHQRCNSNVRFVDGRYEETLWSDSGQSNHLYLCSEIFTLSIQILWPGRNQPGPRIKCVSGVSEFLYKSLYNWERGRSVTVGNLFPLPKRLCDWFVCRITHKVNS